MRSDDFGMVISDFEKLVLKLAKPHYKSRREIEYLCESETGKNNTVTALSYSKSFSAPDGKTIEYGISYVFDRRYSGLDLEKQLSMAHPYFYISCLEHFNRSDPSVHISIDALTCKVERKIIRNGYIRAYMKEIIPKRSTMGQGLKAFFDTVYGPPEKK